MCETSMMPLRVAMPKSVMKPMSEATERTPPERKTPDDAADQGERQVHHDEQGVPHASRRRCAGGGRCRATTRDAEERQEPGRLLGALELAAVLDVVALYAAAERHRAVDPRADVARRRSRRSRPGDVAHDDDLPLHVLAADLVRARSLAGCGPAPSSGHLRAARRVDRAGSPIASERPSAFGSPTRTTRSKAFRPFEHLGDGLAAEGGLDRPRRRRRRSGRGGRWPSGRSGR